MCSGRKYRGIKPSLGMNVPIVYDSVPLVSFYCSGEDKEERMKKMFLPSSEGYVLWWIAVRWSGRARICTQVNALP